MTVQSGDAGRQQAKPLSRLLGAFEPAAFVTDEAGQVQAVNRRFRELVGLDPDEVVGVTPPYPWWPADQRRWFAAQLGHRLESAAKRTKFEGTHVSKDGRRFRVAGSVSALADGQRSDSALLWLFRDTSDLEAALQATDGPPVPQEGEVDLELALRRLFESDLIGIITGEQNRILTANDAFLDMIGTSRAELDDGVIDWTSLTPPEWLEVDAAAGEQMLRTGSSGPIEKEYLRRDGSRVRVRIAGAVVEFEPFRWVSFVEDVTDLARQTERLQEANKRLNELVGMAAHDLRTPIGVIRGVAELLVERRRDELPDEDLMLLQRIERHSDRLLALVDGLLSLSVVERGELSLDRHRHDVAAVLASAVETMTPLAHDKGIGIVRRVQERLFAEIDDIKIEQVVTNLLSNAIKFSPSDTTIEIGARATDATIVIDVTDQGQGIPDSEQEQLFRPFAKTSVRPTGGEPGTGLGLAISQRIVEGHDGTISVQSEEGVGSTFTVVLPRTARRPPGDRSGT